MKKLNVIAISLLVGICGFAKGSIPQGGDDSLGFSTFMRQKGYESIQLEKSLSGHLCLTIQMNDTSGIFILDTGASGTVLDERKQEKYKQTATVLKEDGVGVGEGRLKLKSALVKNFSLGEYKLDSLQIFVVNLDNINAGLMQMGFAEIDGVIGGDILTKGKAIIDYANLILYLKKY